MLNESLARNREKNSNQASLDLLADTRTCLINA
jgi:hypothetical protein